MSLYAVKSLAYRFNIQRRALHASARAAAMLAACCACLPGQYGAALAADLPSSFEATYRISAKGLAVARMTRRFVSSGSSFTVTDETRTTGLAGLLRRESVSEQSHGRIDGVVMQPTRYRYERRRKRSTREKQLSFDWENARVTDDVVNASWNVEPATETFDKLAYQVAIMRDLAAGQRRLTYRIADDQRIKVYELATLATETIDTPSGSYTALKLARTNARGDRRTTFWCAEALDFLAVRVEHEDDGAVTVAELIRYETLDAAAVARPPSRQERLSKNSISRSAGM